MECGAQLKILARSRMFQDGALASSKIRHTRATPEERRKQRSQSLPKTVALARATQADVSVRVSLQRDGQYGT